VQGAQVERLISHTSFQLKGGGWYGDLYASQRPAGSSKAEVGADGKAKGAASSSAEGSATSTASPSSGGRPRPEGRQAKDRGGLASPCRCPGFISTSSTRIVERRRVAIRNKEETMKVRPLYDRILVKRVEEETKTGRGLFHPRLGQGKTHKQGVIVAVGSASCWTTGRCASWTSRRATRSCSPSTRQRHQDGWRRAHDSARGRHPRRH